MLSARDAGSGGIDFPLRAAPVRILRGGLLMLFDLLLNNSTRNANYVAHGIPEPPERFRSFDHFRLLHDSIVPQLAAWDMHPE